MGDPFTQLGVAKNALTAPDNSHADQTLTIEYYDLFMTLDPLVVGTTTDGKKRCDDAGIAHPDNILGLANGSLLVAEDAGKRAHPVDMLWLKK